MFLAIKCSALQMLRSLPKIWISFVNGVSYCWIPKNGFSFKLKNMAQPPSETDLEGRKEWHYSECEILFNKKEFLHVNDGEFALSKLEFDPEWYINFDEKTSLWDKLCPTTKSGPTLPVVHSVIQPECVANELSISSSQPVVHVPLSSELMSMLSEDHQILMNVSTHSSALRFQSELLQSPVGQLPGNLGAECEMQSGQIPLVGHSLIQLECVANECSISSIEQAADVLSSNESMSLLSEDHQIPMNVSTHSSAFRLQSELLQLPVGQFPDNLGAECEIQSEPITSEQEHSTSSNQLEGTLSNQQENISSNQLESTSSNQPKTTSLSQQQPILSDLEQYLENKRTCQLYGFPPPIHYREFQKLKWKYVKTFDINELDAGYTFKTIQEVSLIPRKYDKQFCRPGPLLRGEAYDWYLVDSIVEQVQLKTSPTPFFVVRWVGYEDEFNTVEPLANVKHTAVYELFINPKYTACRLNGCILRRSKRNVLPKETLTLQIMEIEPSIYERTLNKLVTELRIEEKAGRYSSYIGFCSSQSVPDALKAQHRFFINNFCPLIEQLQLPISMDKHYIGPIFGNLSRAPEFKKLVKEEKIMVVQKPNPLADYISRGFSANSKMSEDLPRYVSFMVQRKFDTTEKQDKMQMNFHMCVFTVRRYGHVTDAIYYDPSPKYFAHKLPPVLDNLIDPVLTSFTHNFGGGSEKDDCTFQCMKYIIGIATGEIPFTPNLSEPCRKLDKFTLMRSKKRKLEN